MTNYTQLDLMIVEAIQGGARGFHAIATDRKVSQIVDSAAKATGRDHMRILDGRLQALRKAGRIENERATRHSAGGWRVKA